MIERLITSESVSPGHPDKLADQISDAIIDEVLTRAKDNTKTARCAVETLLKNKLLVIAGEVSPKELELTEEEYFQIAKKVITDVGYTNPKLGFDVEACKYVSGMTPQSKDIANAVGEKGIDENTGAGDQGMMFGYACTDTDVLMPLPITLAHRFLRQQEELRKNGADWLGPDAKSQVTVAYDADYRPKAIKNILISTQHTEQINGHPFKEVLRDKVIEEIIEPELAKIESADTSNCEYLVNPSGRFIVGGPESDTGLTGRKIIVDTYGGAAPHGGGAFSGKDPTKVDRSAAYVARHIAKNVVAAKQAKRCLVQLSYAIGDPKPVSIMIETYGTSSQSEQDLIDKVNKHYNLSPKGIIDMFDLFRPIYQQTATYGHFGRNDIDLPWEDTSKALEYFG